MLSAKKISELLNSREFVFKSSLGPDFQVMTAEFARLNYFDNKPDELYSKHFKLRRGVGEGEQRSIQISM